MNPIKVNNPSSDSTSFPTLPDPWMTVGELGAKSSPLAWQLPLDPSHEISAGPVFSVLHAAGVVGAEQLTAGHAIEMNPATFLLTEELKLHGEAESLKEGIRDAIAWLNFTEIIQSATDATVP